MTRAVVIGGGVVGLACAYSLRKRDYEVTIVDAQAPGAGASEGNAGWVTPSLSMPVPAPGIAGQSLRWMLRSDSPLYVKPTLDPRRIAWLVRLLRNCNERCYARGLAATARLNSKTFELFDELEADGIEFEMHRGGLLFCFLDSSNAPHVMSDLKRVAHLGYSPVLLDGKGVAALEPAIAAEVRAGIYVEQERQVRPESLVTGYVKRLLDEGADVRVATPVTGFERREGKVVAARTGDGVIEGDEFVLAAGAHTGRLARTLGCRIPVDAGKGYSLHFEPAPVEITHGLYLYEARVGATSFDGAVRFAGTMEFSGINTDVNRTRVAAIEKAARRYLTGWTDDARGRAWAGMRPMTPDGLPVIGRVAGNVTVASGHAMLGVTLAPVTGEAVADVIDGGAPEVLRPFDPLRFHRAG
ncbi:MAG: FAD-dependent oxidoreductase [Actinomycetota bacterium]|nr:FAD-dependent oxidoreductase [Actinomycetota bacterium]